MLKTTNVKLEDLEILVFDCEVFSYNWLVVLKRFSDGAVYKFWNEDVDSFLEFIDANKEDTVFVGFNSKHYDQYIVKAIYAGGTVEDVKSVNDFIILGNQGFEHSMFQDLPFSKRLKLHNCDLMDDTQRGTSLKFIEGHLYMSVEESSVDFLKDDFLTDVEKLETEKYCLHDVEATTELLKVRRSYVETKLKLASLCHLSISTALNATDPKLAAYYLVANKKNFNDFRELEFPDRLDYDLIPKDVLKFFEQIHDTSITDEEILNSSLESELGECPIKVGWGGLHGALNQFYLTADENTLILNYDVASLYPSLMIEYGYTSRAIPNPELFAKVREDRFKAKKAGDKETADALKSTLNKTFGAMLNEYNPLYDERMGRSVCVAGQLSILELAVTYLSIEGLKLIQINTDGIMFSIPKSSYDEVLAVNEWWQNQTHLELEEDRIKAIVQKDVNNYALLKTDGKEKIKGSYLVRGESPIGAWSINNNARIVAEAIKQKLLYGVDCDETINSCTDIREFQIIAKASSKYSRVYQECLENGRVEKIPYQKCNRVFAVKNASLGTLFKVKKGSGEIAKIENLPTNCLVFNDAVTVDTQIPNLNKDWYIKLANKRVQDFYKEEGLVMADTKSKADTKAEDYSKLNVYEKLGRVRKELLESGIEMSGKNNSIEYKYFEMSDFVPKQEELFSKYGLLEIFNEVFEPVNKLVHSNDYSELKSKETSCNHYAQTRILNIHNPKEFIDFNTQWNEIEPITNNSGKVIVNAVMRKGSETTYYRRYGKIKALDLVEVDAVDSQAGKVKEQKRPGTKTPVKVTDTEKQNIISNLTTGDAPASKQLITNLKKCIKVVKELAKDDTEVTAYLTELAASTNKLKNINKIQAENAIRTLGDFKLKFEKEVADE